MKKLILLAVLFSMDQNNIYSQSQPPCGIVSNNARVITPSSSLARDGLVIRYINPATGKEELSTAYLEVGDDIAYPLQQASINYYSTTATTTDRYDIAYEIQYENSEPFSFRLWRDGEVPFEFPSNFPYDLKNYIETIMEYLEIHTNICFRERTPSDADAIRFITNYHLPNQTNLPNGWSYIGRIDSQPQQLFINKDVPSNILGGVILHELCHALGLPHQHQMPNRNQHIKLKPENLTELAKRNFRLITKLPDLYVAYYRIQSIMHYGPCAGSENGNYVFDCLNYTSCPADVGQRSRLDAIDVLNINKLYPKKGCSMPSLMLMDVSGSMNENNKFQQAITSCVNTINSIEQESKQSGKTPEIGIMVFSGECVNDPTTMIQPFTSDLDLVRTSIRRIPLPNGSTPLPQAVEQARKTLEAQLAERGQSCGDLILLGDGQSTCGIIRPPMAYSGSVEENRCISKNGAGTAVRMFTIGFGIEPGSEAERDLQYLAFSSGGKYFNAQDGYQLTRSFQKINRIYIPIPFPQLSSLSTVQDSLFSSAVFLVYSQQYDTALVLFQNFIKNAPLDSAGLYNLAQMCEANERYKSAANYYELYLKQALNDPRRSLIQERIITLRKDYEIFIAYMKKSLQSDLAYLNLHFQRLQATPDAVPLAGEFAGFIGEKEMYYKLLPEILEMENTWLKQYSKEVSQSLREADFYLQKKPKVWGDEGVYRLGLVHEPLRRLVKQLGN